VKRLTRTDLPALAAKYACAPETSLVKQVVLLAVGLAAENAELRAALAQVGPAQLALFPEPPAEEVA
jgi:hypothetical protein